MATGERAICLVALSPVPLVSQIANWNKRRLFVNERWTRDGRIPLRSVP
jgi:hypothetical protein